MTDAWGGHDLWRLLSRETNGSFTTSRYTPGLLSGSRSINSRPNHTIGGRLRNMETETSFSRELQEKHVARACMAAGISAGLTLIFGAAAATGVIEGPGFDALMLVDAAILAALGYGVWKRSRICAVLLFICSVVSEIYLGFDQTAHFSLVRLAFIYFYFRGAIQLFRDHRRRAAPQPVNT